MGLEQLGFYGDTWAALRAGLRAALRAGLRAGLRTGPPGHATRRAARPCYASGRRAALRVGPPGRAARRTNYSATSPLDLIHTNGHRGPAPLESTAGFMYRTLGLCSGVGLGLLESTTHRWTGQLGPHHQPAPARTCSHTWLGTQAGAGRATWAKPGWNWWKAETMAGRARTGRALDVGVMGK
jgi:hypothetical protein